MAKLVEVVKSYMVMKGKHFASKCEGRAILFSYGSDGTPITSSASISSEIRIAPSRAV